LTFNERRKKPQF